MAQINLENIAASAAITIQLIKDYSMYDSEIISSNGTIFQSVDTSTTLTLKVYKGIEDISNRISDIEWSKFYFQNDEIIEDQIWGLDKKNKPKITLNKDDIEDKNIIQANGYSTIEGKRELVTTARITMIKISDIYISDLIPINPSDNMMWMDTNIVPPTLKIWNSNLGYWMSSGMDIPVVKNLIRNSNFWTDLSSYYSLYNSSFIDTNIVSVQNKKWLSLKSKNANSREGGVYQEIQYPITPNSNYMFSFIAYKDAGTNLITKIVSIDSSGRSTELVNKGTAITSAIQTIEIPFTTSNDTNKIVIYLCTEERVYGSFYITELSLYNASVYYPWEPCPEDVDKQMSTKLDNSRSSVFNTLTNNGEYKAIYESNGQYYIKAEYIYPEVVSKTTYDQLVTDYNNLKTDYNNLKTDYNNLKTDYNNLKTDYNEFKKTYETEKQNINNLVNSLIKRIEDLENADSGPEGPTE